MRVSAQRGNRWFDLKAAHVVEFHRPAAQGQVERFAIDEPLHEGANVALGRVGHLGQRHVPLISEHCRGRRSDQHRGRGGEICARAARVHRHPAALERVRGVDPIGQKSEGRLHARRPIGAPDARANKTRLVCDESRTKKQGVVRVVDPPEETITIRGKPLAMLDRNPQIGSVARPHLLGKLTCSFSTCAKFDKLAQIIRVLFLVSETFKKANEGRRSLWAGRARRRRRAGWRRRRGRWGRRDLPKPDNVRLREWVSFVVVEHARKHTIEHISL